VTRVHPTEPAPEHPDRPAFDGLASRLARAIDPMLRPVTVAAVAVEDLDAIAVVHGADAVRALDAAWNERLRALAPAPAAVLAAGPGEAVVALPASTPDLRTAVASLGGTGQPILALAGTPVRLRTAVGTATLDPGSAMTAEALISCARNALARARRGPAPRVHAHADGDAHAVLEGLQVAAMLQQALERGAFRLVFLPKVRVIDRAVIGAEALIRWTLPSTGEAVPARRLLDAAADAGLLDEVGAWALREACRRAAAWCAEGAEVPVSVNIAPSQFRRGDLVDQVHLALGEAGLPGRLLSIEVPEGVLASDGDAVAAQLEAVRAAGASIAIDDFGTGIDGIACLHRCGADEVKLDRSVVARLPGSAEDRATLDLVQRHARRLGARCVAEGIERADQWALLSERAWDAAQGWLVSRPIDGADVPAFAQGGAAGIPVRA
jgi:EAL domain-containing protein (putative c-di-GMP-specific phosphodiesterase class I)/GGDEF domain-containing protein